MKTVRSPIVLATLSAMLAIFAAPASAQTLPNRVSAGDVTTTTAVLWARASALGSVTFDVSSDPLFVSIVQHRTVAVTEVAKPAKTVAEALHPGTTYYYRATDALGATDSGVFQTAPLASTDAAVRFGVSGDARGELAPFRAVANVPSRNLAFFVHLGDSIYADVASPALPGVSQAVTLGQFRAKQAENCSSVLGVNGLGDVRVSTALFATMDDHEVTNDFAGGAHPSTDPRFDQTGSFINSTNLYKRGVQAFVEYHPIASTLYGAGTDPRTSFKPKLYRHRTHGHNAAIFLLDARSFRDLELPSVTNPLNPAQVGAFQLGSFNPTRTMLGARQLADLLADLRRADEAGIVWKFIMVPEPIQNLGVVGGADRFEGYAAERTALLAFISARGIRNVVFVSADIHGTLVNNLTYQTAPGGPQIPTSAFEITTGPIAYQQPFGPTVVGIAASLGLVSSAQLAFYNSLPTAAKDQFVQTLVNTQLGLAGLDALGLGGSPVNATLLQGSYVATHTFRWTEFEIPVGASTLLVTTYGVDPAQPNSAPAVVSRFSVARQ